MLAHDPLIPPYGLSVVVLFVTLTIVNLNVPCVSEYKENKLCEFMYEIPVLQFLKEAEQIPFGVALAVSNTSRLLTSCLQGGPLSSGQGTKVQIFFYLTDKRGRTP
jgi:hypothetical protein